jgi:multicomponent Na+:H+ antiporter subunit A
VLAAGRPLLLTAAVLGSALLVAAAVVAGWLPFRARPAAAATHAHEVAPALFAPALALAALGVAAGVAPGIADALLFPASAAVAGAPPAERLALFHGWTGAALSAATLALGAVAVAARPRLRSALGSEARASRDAFRGVLRLLEATAKRHTAVLQTGSLRRYLAVTFGVAAALLAAGFVRGGAAPAWTLGAPRAPEVVVGALAMAAAVAAVRSRSRLAAIAALGGVGYAIGLLFLLFGAPDLAMTQIAVETVTVMVFLVAFRHLPRFNRLSSAASRTRDAILAGAVGILMAALVLSAAGARSSAPISTWHVERSVPDAHGRNVVNTILVDFRGLDTLGEATVLVIAGFGIVALLKLRPRRDA